MKIKTLQEVSLDTFFSKYTEFSDNPVLDWQKNRVLKLISRHSKEDILAIAEKHNDDYCFELNGKFATYIVIFSITNSSIVLKNIVDRF